MFSLKIPNPQIDTLRDLLDSKKQLVAFFAFMEKKNVQYDPVYSKIIEKIEHNKRSIGIREMFQDKSYIIDTALGKSAMIFAHVPLKSIVIRHLKEVNNNTKFRFLKETFYPPLLITLASSTRLTKVFRTDFNIR